MRARVFGAVVLLAGVVACDSGDRAPQGSPATTTADAPRVPDRALVGIITRWDGSGTVVAPLDRRSLRPGRPRAQIGEYHDAWSVSPDGGRIALGISAPGADARIGIRILDRATLRTARDVETGIVAEAVGWVSRERVGAILQSGEAFVVDAVGGEVVARQAVPVEPDCLYAPPTAVTPLGLVVLLAGSDGRARLILVEAQALARIVRLGRIRMSAPGGVCERAGLAIDPSTLHAYVVGARAPVAEVDLRTQTVRHHAVAPAVVRCGGCSVRRDALWLGSGRLVVSSLEHTTRTETPAGVALVDTRRGTVRPIHAGAGGATLAGDRLLVYDGGRPPLGRHRLGLWSYDRDGRNGVPLLRGDGVWDVQVAGQRAYSRGTRRLHVIDLRRGQVVARSRPVRSDIVVLPNG